LSFLDNYGGSNSSVFECFSSVVGSPLKWFSGNFSGRGKMETKNIANFFTELCQIMSGEDIVDNKSKDVRLKELAKRIDASTLMYQAAPANADETEPVKNILTSLQAAAMVDTARAANKNYKIAVGATIFAGLSALAAWIAILIA